MLPDVGDEGLVGLKTAVKSETTTFLQCPGLTFVSGAYPPDVVYDCSMAAQNMMLIAYIWGLEAAG